MTKTNIIICVIKIVRSTDLILRFREVARFWDVGCAQPGFAPYLARIRCPKVRCVHPFKWPFWLLASEPKKTLACIRVTNDPCVHLFSESLQTNMIAIEMQKMWDPTQNSSPLAPLIPPSPIIRTESFKVVLVFVLFRIYSVVEFKSISTSLVLTAGLLLQ